MVKSRRGSTSKKLLSLVTRVNVEYLVKKDKAGVQLLQDWTVNQIQNILALNSSINSPSHTWSR